MKSRRKKSLKKAKKSRKKFHNDGVGENKRRSEEISKTPIKLTYYTPPTSTNQPERKKIKIQPVPTNNNKVFVRLYNKDLYNKDLYNKNKDKDESSSKKNLDVIRKEINNILNLHGYFPEYSEDKIFKNYIYNETYDGYSRDAFEFLGDRVLKYIQGLISFEKTTTKNPSNMTQFNVQLEKNYTFNCYLRHGIGDKDICTLMGINSLSISSTEKQEKTISKKCADLFESLIGSIFYFYYKKQNLGETVVFEKIRDWLYDQTPFGENVKYLTNIQTKDPVLFKQTDESSAPSYHFCEILKKKKKDEIRKKLDIAKVKTETTEEQKKIQRSIRFGT